MRPQSKAIVFITVCLTVGAVLKPASSQQPPPSVPPPTIEPSLPVRVDMQLVSVNETGHGGTALLEVSVEAGTRISEFSMDLRLPGDLRVQDGTPANGWMLSLEASEHRRYEIPLFADHNGVFPIRVEMSFRLPDGRSFRAGQGTTLRLGAPQAVGRMNAGAYEFRGVPLEDLQR
jgi:hypothetical protein